MYPLGSPRAFVKYYWDEKVIPYPKPFIQGMFTDII